MSNNGHILMPQAHKPTVYVEFKQAGGIEFGSKFVGNVSALQVWLAGQNLIRLAEKKFDSGLADPEPVAHPTITLVFEREGLVNFEMASEGVNKQQFWMAGLWLSRHAMQLLNQADAMQAQINQQAQELFGKLAR